MLIHKDDLAKLAERKQAEQEQTLGKYLIEKFGGRASIDSGSVYGENLYVEMKDLGIDNKKLREGVKSFYEEKGFSITNESVFGFSVKHPKKNLTRVVSISHEKSLGWGMITAQKVCKSLP